MPRSFRVRILTQNLWHGLDHTKPLLMPPAENPIAAWLRRGALLRGLRLLRHPEARLGAPSPEPAIAPVLDIFCFQELNPVDRRLEALKSDLHMEGACRAGNVGFQVGPISYPPLLQEGLGILWAGAARHRGSFGGTLSGEAFEKTFRTPLRGARALEIMAHVSERRVFLATDFEFGGHAWLVVNLHLHSGSPARGASERRRIEIERLLAWLLPRRANYDVVLVVGDFNSEMEHPEMQRLAAEGFRDLPALDASGQVLPTWDPFRNALCRRSMELSRAIPANYEWDGQYHAYDHILMWAREPSAWKAKVSRTFDDPSGKTWVSDHFGLLAEIKLANP